MAILMAISIAALIVGLGIYKLRAGLRDINHVPGIISAFSPLSALGAALPCTSWNPGHEWVWYWRRTGYFNHTHDIISAVPFVLGSPSLYTDSLDVMKQLLTEEGTRLIKPRELSSALQWGDNITSVNGDEWRTHRRIVAPSFNNRMYGDVWRSTRAVYSEIMNSERWGEQQIVKVPHFNAMMLRVTITIISSCGFGLNLKWADEETALASRLPSGHLEFPEALRIVSETFIHRLLIPSFVWRLPIPRLREIRNAWHIVEKYIYNCIDNRKTEDPDVGILEEQELPGDMLNRLVTAWSGVGRYSLSRSEILADMLSLVFAGHESTASGLSATFAYLAVHPQVQQKAFEEIARAFTDNNPAEAIDANQLQYTFCCFLEALRLVPSPFFLPRRAADDIILDIVRPSPGKIVVNKGTLIMIDLVGIHRNPHVFEDPETYRPERWLGVHEQDIPVFGFGPRSCIGRKFAQTEVMCFIASFIYDFKIEPLFGKAQGNTLSQWEETVLGRATLTGTAFGLKDVPLKFTRRHDITPS